MSTTPDYASKVAALLAKANDPAATPEEAETYSAKAEALMVKWGISDAELDAKRKGQRKAAEKIVEVNWIIKGADGRTLNRLAFAIAQGFGNVRCLQASVYGSTMDKRVYFIGHESDVARAKALYESLAVQASHARGVWFSALDKTGMTGNDKFLAKRQFVWSFSDAVQLRLTATRKAAEGEVTKSTELVLVDRAAKVDDYMATAYPKLGKGRASNGSDEGRAAGRAAGQRANLGGTQVGSGSKGALK